MFSSHKKRKLTGRSTANHPLKRQLAFRIGILIPGALVILGLLFSGCMKPVFMGKWKAKRFLYYRGQDAAVLLLNVNDKRASSGVLHPRFYFFVDGKRVYGGESSSLYYLNRNPLCLLAGKHILTWQFAWGDNYDDTSASTIFKDEVDLAAYGEYQLSIEITDKSKIYRSFDGPFTNRLKGEPRQRLIEIVQLLGTLDTVPFEDYVPLEIRNLFNTFEPVGAVILRQLLDNGDREMQLGSVRGLGLMEKKALFTSQRLIECLSSNDPELLVSVAWALPRIDNSSLEGTDNALLNLYSDADSRLRYAILNGMARIQSLYAIKKCFPIVKDALSDGRPEISKEARKTLGAFRQSLAQYLNDWYSAADAKNLINSIDAALKEV